MMTTLVEIVRNYVNPPEVKELCREYLHFEMLVPANTSSLPKFMQVMVEKRYELGGNSPPTMARMVEELPQLEQKIEELEKKYFHRTAFGFGMAAASITYLFVDVALRGINPYLAAGTAREVGLYVASFVGATTMLHGIQSSSTLLTIKGVKYRVNSTLKQALSISKKIPGTN